MWGDYVDTEEACSWGALQWLAKHTSNEGWSQRDGLKMPLAGSDCETVWIAHSQTMRSHNRQSNGANKTYHSKSQSASTRAWMEQIESACRHKPGRCSEEHTLLSTSVELRSSRWIIKSFCDLTSQRTYLKAKFWCKVHVRSCRKAKERILIAEITATVCSPCCHLTKDTGAPELLHVQLPSSMFFECVANYNGNLVKLKPAAGADEQQSAWIGGFRQVNDTTTIHQTLLTSTKCTCSYWATVKNLFLCVSYPRTRLLFTGKPWRPHCTLWSCILKCEAMATTRSATDQALTHDSDKRPRGL